MPYYDEDDYEPEYNPRKQVDTTGIDQYIRGVSPSGSKQGINAQLKQKLIEFFEQFVEDRSTKISSMATLILAMIQEL